MSATDILRLVYALMPVAFFLDLLIFGFSLIWLDRWRKRRRAPR